MGLRITGKHMDIGEAFRGRIDGRIGETIAKYFDGGYSGHVNVSKSGSRFTTDCLIHLDSGVTLQTKSEAQDPVVAFEGAAERLEKRLRRYKRRLKSRSFGSANGPVTDVAYAVMEAIPEDAEDEIPEDYSPAVVAETTLSLRTMSVASAVIELDARESAVVVFRNAGNAQVNIVYRRPDGNIGWIDPSTAKSAAS